MGVRHTVSRHTAGRRTASRRIASRRIASRRIAGLRTEVADTPLLAAAATRRQAEAGTLRRATAVVVATAVVGRTVAEAEDPTEAVRRTATAAADITGDKLT